MKHPDLLKIKLKLLSLFVLLIGLLLLPGIFFWRNQNNHSIAHSQYSLFSMETYQQIYQQYQATIAKKYLVIVGPIRNRSNAEDAAYNILLYEKQYAYRYNSNYVYQSQDQYIFEVEFDPAKSIWHVHYYLDPTLLFLGVDYHVLLSSDDGRLLAAWTE